MTLPRPGRRRPARPSRAVAAAICLLASLLVLPGVARAEGGGDRSDHKHRALRALLCHIGDNDTERELLGCLTAKGALRHLAAFERIAEANDGTRASGTPGYQASVDYVVKRLRLAGYQPVIHPFDFLFYSEESTVTLDGTELERFDLSTNEGEYNTMTYSGSGVVTSDVLVPTNDVVVPIGDSEPNTSTSGCEPEDFEPAPEADAIALVQRGECPFLQKSLNAQDAGYDAVVVFNEGQVERDGVVLGTLGEEAIGALDIPVIGVSYEFGAELIASGGTLSIDVDSVAETRETYNVTADLPGTDPGNVVMVGGHLDSVVEGAGINDNGSGSAAVLETALKMAKNEPQNTVRFAWWGAEEFGLIGSTNYVEGLTPEQTEEIALYLNFDMVGSPNYVQFVYDGDQSTFEATAPVPAGSAEIEGVFREFFDGRTLPAADTEFSGRSDYEAFIFAGIPSGGLFTGAEGVKTEEEAAEFGGVAGLSYDPCYHQPCDTLDRPNTVPELQEAYGRALFGNINLTALDQNLDAIGYATLLFSESTELVDAAPEPEPEVASAGAARAKGHGPIDRVAS